MPTSGSDLGYDEISISNIPAKQSILSFNSVSLFATPKTAGIQNCHLSLLS